MISKKIILFYRYKEVAERVQRGPAFFIPPVVTSYLITVQYQNQQTGFGTMRVYSFMPFYYMAILIFKVIY